MDLGLRQGELGLESESFFHTLAEMVPQMVWTKNADGVNDYCNRRFREYMGLTVDEFRDNSWIVAHPDGIVDLSMGTPVDPAPGVAIAAEVHSKSRWHTTTARDRCAGGQDSAAGGG